MNKTYQLAVVGGGASGLALAIEACLGQNAINGKSVVILEGQDRVGKKLVATGNGQGNLTNDDFSEKYYHGDRKFIEAFMENARKVDIKSYLYSLGIPLISCDGKVYPLSKQASAVLDAFRSKLEYLGVEERVNFKVDKIIADKGEYTIYAGKEFVRAKHVALCFGGASAKQFGTDGSAYALAESLGHKKTKIYPSLVQLKTDLTKIRGLKGLKETAKVIAYDGEKELSSSIGEVLFTDYGVSGSAIFSVSGYLTGAKNPSVKIEFLPQYDMENTRRIIEDRMKNAPTEYGEKVLSCVLNKRIGGAVYRTATGKTAKDLAYAIKNFRLKVTGDLGFNYAQVTKGGIEVCGVNPCTYESNIRKNLYLTGELLDVDGDCGGYNLTFAFVSGITSARAIKTKLSGAEKGE